MAVGNVSFTQPAKQSSRIPRRPQHPFHIKHEPFAIQPFLIAPVLPGETMKNLLIQARVITSPIKNSIVGWWQEYYVFYVKHRDMEHSELFQAMMLDPSAVATAAIPAAAAPRLYTIDDNGGINWVSECLNAVVEHFFRDEGEAVTVQTIGGLPAAGINSTQGFMQSILDAASETFDDMTVETTSADLGIQQFDESYRLWQFLQASQLTNASYEDYLRTFGVRAKLAEKEQKPELLRYIRSWQYPSNTIDPADGSAASAVSWAIAERADKDRFFPEPGFIFGVTVTRPKVYFGKQKAFASQWLDNAWMWLPAMFNEAHHISLRTFANNQGPLSGETTNGYIVDMRDIFIHGDQFVNYDPEGAGADNSVDLPTAALQHTYPSEAMVDGLFVSGDSTGGVQQDGVVSLQILGHQRDFT